MNAIKFYLINNGVLPTNDNDESMYGAMNDDDCTVVTKESAAVFSGGNIQHSSSATYI